MENAASSPAPSEPPNSIGDTSSIPRISSVENTRSNASPVNRPRKTTRAGTFFPPVVPPSNASTTARSNFMTPTTISITQEEQAAEEDAYVWAEMPGRGRPLIRYSRNDRLTANSGSRSGSASSSRSTSPVTDERRLSTMLLTGKAPSTPVQPIWQMSRQHTFVKEKIIVGVRLRPFIAEDLRNLDGDSKQPVVTMKSEGPKASVQVQTKTASMVFEFDHGFSSIGGSGAVGDEDSDQKTIFEMLAQPLVESMISGYNCSFFAYGQTGTGKTYSTMGTTENPGVVPRFCQALLKKIKDAGNETWTVEISYYEVYNENIFDLLNGKAQQAKLKVREHPEEGPFVEDLRSISVKKYEDIEKWLNSGNAARHSASTARNDGSSRSHAVFCLKLVQMKTVGGRPMVRKSKANFVDLAGSERLDPRSTSVCNVDRMAEMKNINKSLVFLSTVIVQLASSGDKNVHINYRNSVLTWLLKDSLGGNAKTVMLATVAPAAAYAEETLSTLRYAANAYRIYNKACINEDPAIGLMEQLKQENEALKALMSTGANAAFSSTADDVAALEARNIELTQALRDKEAELERQKQFYEAELEKQKRSLETLVLQHNEFTKETFKELTARCKAICDNAYSDYAESSDDSDTSSSSFLAELRDAAAEFME